MERIRRRLGIARKPKPAAGSESEKGGEGSLVNSRRSSIKILRDLLRALHGGARVTAIMRRANLNHAAVCRYLGRLERAGLVRFANSHFVWELPPRGLETLRDIEEFLSQPAAEARPAVKPAPEIPTPEQLIEQCKGLSVDEWKTRMPPEDFRWTAEHAHSEALTWLRDNLPVEYLQFVRGRMSPGDRAWLVKNFPRVKNIAPGEPAFQKAGAWTPEREHKLDRRNARAVRETRERISKGVEAERRERQAATEVADLERKLEAARRAREVATERKAELEETETHAEVPPAPEPGRVGAPAPERVMAEAARVAKVKSPVGPVKLAKAVERKPPAKKVAEPQRTPESEKSLREIRRDVQKHVIKSDGYLWLRKSDNRVLIVTKDPDTGKRKYKYLATYDRRVKQLLKDMKVKVHGST